MLTRIEQTPLRHLQLGTTGIVLGIVLFIGGLIFLLAGPVTMLVVAVAMMAFGASLGFISGYYRGCENGACTPSDT